MHQSCVQKECADKPLALDVSLRFTRKNRGLVACAVSEVEMVHAYCQCLRGCACTHYAKGEQIERGRMYLAFCCDCSRLSVPTCGAATRPRMYVQDIPCSKIFVEALDVDGEQVAYLRVCRSCQCAASYTGP
jgi:hypothetical protein